MSFQSAHGETVHRVRGAFPLCIRRTRARQTFERGRGSICRGGGGVVRAPDGAALRFFEMPHLSAGKTFAESGGQRQSLGDAVCFDDHPSFLGGVRVRHFSFRRKGALLILGTMETLPSCGERNVRA